MEVTKTYWKNKDGEYQDISKMSDSYLANTINHYLNNPMIGGEDNSLVELAEEVQERHEEYREDYIERINDGFR